MRRSPNLSRLGGGHETQRHHLSVRKNEAIAFFPHLSRLGGGHETQRQHLSVRKNEAIAFSQFE
ncbi:hypothetical protein AAEJ74_25460 [Limnospira fusiformis PMC 851.14]|uniref:Uncharacterized protein n=1 Tax=Limnospira fusiformis PMC 851.14 TaxID=2219512 RepID=A0ABU9ESE0_LIMFS